MSNSVVMTSATDMVPLRYALSEAQYPCLVSFNNKIGRSAKQNRLQFQWLKDAAEQGDQTVEEYRAYCKLHHGVPILRAEDKPFNRLYNQIIRPLPYEQKLEAMIHFDLPVTSRLSVKAMTQYLDAMSKDLWSQGFQLTDPSLLGMPDWRGW